MPNLPTQASSESERTTWPVRRRHGRRNVISSQLITVDLGTQGQGLVIDIGEGGMQVQPFLPLRAGDASDIGFEVPGTNARFEGTAMVAWVGSGGRAGIQFLNVPEASRAVLREWLTSSPAEQKCTQAASTTAFSARAPQTLACTPVAERDSGDEPLDVQAALMFVAERVVRITGAHGAAIAIGDACGMFCRVSVGKAPDVGMPVHADSGLSGFCLRSSQLVQCDDTQNDPRVDPVARRELDLRSVLIVPVMVGERLLGLLEVFSSKPYAFDTRDRERLSRMAQVIAAVIDGGELWRLKSFELALK